MELYLVLFDRTFGGLHGNVDRVFTTDLDAKLYCTAQNAVSIAMGFEHWIVYIIIDGTQNAYAERIYNPKEQSK